MTRAKAPELAFQSPSKILWVGSGKGGVGKSTVATNLACAMAALGRSVRLIDCDFQGPSITTLMGVRQLSPPLETDGKKRVIHPFYKYGVHFLSMGNLVEEHTAIQWRGPMMQKALERFFIEVKWPECEWTVIDLPPGTGDVPMALAQLLGPALSVLVTTPQELALQDAFRAAHSWHQLGTSITAVVENMSGFEEGYSIPALPPLFGASKLKDLQERLCTPLAIRVPFVFGIREMEEIGCPLAFKGKQTAPWFFELAQQLIAQIEEC